MTLKELQNLPYLGAEIEMYTDRLNDLRDRMGCAAPPMSGMPHGSGVVSKVENISVEIADLEQKITRRKAEQARLTAYINGISSSFTRTIFYARFSLGLRWEAVAEYVGGDCTAESAKKICYRKLNQDHISDAS